MILSECWMKLLEQYVHIQQHCNFHQNKKRQNIRRAVSSWVNNKDHNKNTRQGNDDRENW